MKALFITETGDVVIGRNLLVQRELPVPQPGRGQIRLRVLACGVCHTEIDEIEGRAAPPNLPVIPGHEVVGRVDALGAGAVKHRVGDRAGVGWIYDSCGTCQYCKRGLENLCPDFVATGRDVNGGYAEYMVVPEDSAFPIPEVFTDEQAAPLLCAGAVGYRSLRLADIENGQSLGFYGFGVSAHLVLQMAGHRYPDSKLSVISRSAAKQKLARNLGADWAGPPGSKLPGLMPPGSVFPRAAAPSARSGGATSPIQLDAIIDTTPLWRPIEEGMRLLAPGGKLIVNAIGKIDTDKAALSDIHYQSHLWMEKQLISVANVTRSDIREALKLAAEIPIRPTIEPYQLEDANRALYELNAGIGRGAKVLLV